MGLEKEMSEFNLTIGQAIDLMNAGKVVESEHREKYYRYNYGHRNMATQHMLCVATSLKFREYIEPKPVKIITWYRPKYIWDKNYVHPTINMNKRFFPTQEQASRSLSLNEKIINWETLEAAETWEQCE